MQTLIGFNVSSRAISSFHFRLLFSGFTINEVVTFGAPKFMDTMSTDLLQIVAQLRRVTLEGDPIPAFPPLRSYSHAGLEVLALPLLSVLIICWQLRSSPFLLLLWVLVSYGSSIRECVGVSRFFGVGPTNPPPLSLCLGVDPLRKSDPMVEDQAELRFCFFPKSLHFPPKNFTQFDIIC